jgi:putative ABC transport system substrate-binding protein
VAVLRTEAGTPKAFEQAGKALRIQLQVLVARSRQELDEAFPAMVRARSEALLVVPTPLFIVHRTRLAELATKVRLPTMYGAKEYVEVGGLMAYGANVLYNYRHAAVYVDKLLKGARPADLPVEQPAKFELVINLKTAKALGLTVPPSLLLRADEMIE